MAPVDLSTFSADLKAARDAVCSDSGDVTWAIFGYKGDSLKVVDQDNTSLEDFLEEFEGAKIQYGFIKVTDPNQAVDKFVLINWSGEGAPVLRKGACAHHVRDVENYFRAHVTINARNETDLDAEAILKLVAKSSGAAYSNHKEKPSEKFSAKTSGPVGSSYQNEFKSRGVASNDERSKFWSSQQKEEEARLADLEAKKQEEQKQIEKQRAAEAQAAMQAQQQPEPEPEPVPVPVPVPTECGEPEPFLAPPVEEPAPVEDVPAPVTTEGDGLCATAIYDYQAEDDGEVSFDPGDRITQIEQIDEGWWQGWCKGAYGLFPANYVELDQ